MTKVHNPGKALNKNDILLPLDIIAEIQSKLGANKSIKPTHSKTHLSNSAL